MSGDRYRIGGLESTLLTIGSAIWIIAAIAPADRTTWLLENMVLVAGVTWIIATYKKWRLSPISYVLIFIFFVLHVVGAHYTYSATPLGDWLAIPFDAQRNHYDRLVHFLFGLLMVYPISDQIGQAARLSEKSAFLVAFLLIVATSTGYELLEWAAAEIVSPEDAFAFLGTQGDVFDAQKDTALAVAGALLGLGISAPLTFRRSRLVSMPT